MLRQQAPATPCGLTSHSASTASAPDGHMPRAPCTPATAPSNAAVTLPLPAPQRHSCSRPPAACPQPPLRAPVPLLRVPRRAHSAAPRSRPTRCDNHAPSPENHSARQTRSSRPSAADQDHPCDTSARRLCPHTDHSQIVRPSALLAASTRALRLRHRCTTLQPLLPALLPVARPARTPACSPLVGPTPRGCARAPRHCAATPATARPPCTPLVHSGCTPGSPAACSARAPPTPATAPHPPTPDAAAVALLPRRHRPAALVDVTV